MSFSWSTIFKPIIALSPMADMTDSPFCLLCKEFGAEVVFREMVSSEALVRENEKTFEMARFDEKERPIIQQIFGGDPKTMARAAIRIEEKFHPDGIDINMGCPVYKIVSNFNGASLMKDRPRATEMVQRMKSVLSVPLSVKLRLGWSKPDEILDFIQYIEAAGADLITIHGRTKEQGYSGKSDWEMIAKAKQKVCIPILANGDVHDATQIPQALAISKCDGILVARGALGNPWYFTQAKEICATGTIRTIPSFVDRVHTALAHARMHVAHYGPRGIISFRKHIAWYFKGTAGTKELRNSVVRVQSIKELEEIFTESLHFQSQYR